VRNTIPRYTPGEYQRILDCVEEASNSLCLNKYVWPNLDDQSSGKISASSADYNSVFMGIELGQTFLESGFTGSGQWGVRLGREEQTGSGDEPAYRYPGLTLASFDIFNIKITSLATQIPYDRNTLVHKRGNEFYTRGAETWALNTHSSSPGAATLNDDARLLAGYFSAGKAIALESEKGGGLRCGGSEWS